MTEGQHSFWALLLTKCSNYLNTQWMATVILQGLTTMRIPAMSWIFVTVILENVRRSWILSLSLCNKTSTVLLWSSSSWNFGCQLLRGHSSSLGFGEMKQVLRKYLLICFNSLFSWCLSRRPFCWKAPPQHDTATAMLLGGGAIRRLMSYAQFPSDRELCLMDESPVSISSEESPLPCCFPESPVGIFHSIQPSWS